LVLFHPVHIKLRSSNYYTSRYVIFIIFWILISSLLVRLCSIEMIENIRIFLVNQHSISFQIIEINYQYPKWNEWIHVDIVNFDKRNLFFFDMYFLKNKSSILQFYYPMGEHFNTFYSHWYCLKNVSVILPCSHYTFVKWYRIKRRSHLIIILIWIYHRDGFLNKKKICRIRTIILDLIDILFISNTTKEIEYISSW
jgi:hypothetical protein